MFSRPQKPYPRGEEENLLGHPNHELGLRSPASPTATASLQPPSPQPTSPLKPASPRSHSHFFKGNMPSSLGLKGSTTTIPNIPSVSDNRDALPTTINDPFTGEPKATLIPDPPNTLGSPFPVFETCGIGSATQDRFWSHVARIRELQSEVARMHISMESIGRQPKPQPPKEKEKEKEKPRKFRGQTTGTRPGIGTDRDETGQSASDTDHAGSGRDTRSGPKLSEPTSAGITIDIGDHFAQREDTIKNIMKKLSELSHQVSEFHQLPTPEITFPISSSRQAQLNSPTTPTQASTLSIPSPSTASLAYQTPHTMKTTHTHLQSSSGQAPTPPRIMIPKAQLLTPGAQTQATTPYRSKPHSIISQDGTFHESPSSLQPGPTP